MSWKSLLKLPAAFIRRYECRRWNKLGLKALASYRELSNDRNAHLRVAIDMACKVAAYKQFAEDPRYIYVYSYTKSTRALVGNIRSLYSRPPGIWSGTTKQRAAYDWCYTETSTGEPIDAYVLGLVLRGQEFTSPDWEHTRTYLLTDVVLYCTLVLERMSFR